MNIMFDLNHPVDVNFFKNSIEELEQESNKIMVIFRGRGKLEKIVNFELGKYSPIEIGKHSKKIWSKVIGQIWRDVRMISILKKYKIALVVSFGGISSIPAKILGIPYLDFDDDFEYKLTFYRGNIFSTRHIMPDYINFANKKTWKYKGFKELAYLYPGKFNADKDSLEKLNLTEGDYVFIREIANVSLNYKDENKSIINIVSYIVNKGKKVVISLEDNDLKKVLEDKCIVLKEPVEDLYSILRYAQFALSSGDTMAREACLLGTPCIYTGGREMVMNNELIEMGIMYKEDSVESIFKRIDLLINDSVSQELSNKINAKIKNEWADTTEVILGHINEFIK